METTGGALVEHWTWAAGKGLMNAWTARAMKTACKDVLSVMEGWESLDVRTLDVDDALRRFQNLRGKKFKPQSLEAYKQRFRHAHKSFLSYIDDPSGWKAGGRFTRNDSVIPAKKPVKPIREESGLRSLDQASPLQSRLVDYPFPLREGRMALLRLPVDLSPQEARRLSSFVATLVIEEAGEPE